MGIRALYPRAKNTRRNLSHKVPPCLLRDFQISKVKQVWCTNITYIPMRKGFLSLVPSMDWYPEVLFWRLSNSLDAAPCIDALEEALAKQGTPDIFNSDQGGQFPSDDFTGILKDKGILISLDGKGPWIDNVFIERLWRSLKYEEVYLKAYNTVAEARENIGGCLSFYNQDRRHDSLDKMTPFQVYDDWPSGLPKAV